MRETTLNYTYDYSIGIRDAEVILMALRAFIDEYDGVPGKEKDVMDVKCEKKYIENICCIGNDGKIISFRSEQ